VELKGSIASLDSKPMRIVAHYVGDEKLIHGKFKRIHECSCYEKSLIRNKGSSRARPELCMGWTEP